MIDDGEREAIALAVEVRADALLMDDRDGRREAEVLNCPVLGTVRVLADAAQRGFADLQAALEGLRLTNFRVDGRLLEEILNRARGTTRSSVSALQFGGKPKQFLDLAVDGHVDLAIFEVILDETRERRSSTDEGGSGAGNDDQAHRIVSSQDDKL